MISDLDRYLTLTDYSTKELTLNRQVKCGQCKRQFAIEQTTADKQDLHCPYCQAPIPYLPPETVAEAARRGFYGSPPPMDEGDDPR